MSNQRVLWIPLALGALTALTVAVQRIGLERGYRTVGLVADYQEAAALATFSGRPVAAGLGELQAAGLTAIAVEEPQLEDLVQSGELTCEPTAGETRLLDHQADDAAPSPWLTALGSRYGRQPENLADGGQALTLPVPWPVLKQVGGGLDPVACDAVRTAGLEVVARLRNSSGLTPVGLEAALREARERGARVLIAAGDEVLGFRSTAPVVAGLLQDLGLVWGRVEFSQQKGEARLAQALLEPPLSASYVRVHSITEGELGKLSPALCVERYRRAAVERNVRLCFVRLLLDPDADLLTVNREFVQKISAAIRAEGLTLGRPAPLPRFQLGKRRLVIGALGVAAATGYLLTLLAGGWSVGRWLGWWLLIAVPSTAVGLVKPDLYAKVMALLGGLVFPTLGARWAWERLTLRPPRSLLGAVAAVWITVGWAVLGGLLTVGLLSQTSYFLAHNIFSGVKLTQLLPLLAGFVLLTTSWTLPEVGRASVRERWQAFWRNPVVTAHVAIALVAFVMLALLLLRSGNEGVEISETELRLRALLENVFGARPRTKEALLGHPALLLAFLAAWRGRREWVAPTFLVGLIGVVSTFNTFCHLHTPLTQSLLRTFHALWLGCLLGGLVWLAAGWRGGRRDG